MSNQPERPDFCDECDLHEALKQAQHRIAELEIGASEHADVVEDLHLHQEELRVQNEDLRQAQDALAAASRRYQDLFDFAPVGYFLLDDKGVILEANVTACLLLEQPHDALLRRPMRLHLSAEARLAFDLFLVEAASGRQARTLETLVQNHDREPLPVQITLLVDRTERAPRFRLAVVDIRERRQADEQRKLAAVMFEESNEGMLVTDPIGRIQRVNRAFTVVTGYAEPEVIGHKPSMLASGRHDAVFYKSMWDRLQNSGSWMGEIWNRRKNGEIYPEWLKINAVRDVHGDIRHFVGIFSDISEHKGGGQEVERLALYDTLTDLPNRVLFVERLKHALIRAHRDGRPVALLYLDLDRFKSVNDTLGHQTGDLLLQQVAARLRQIVRNSDTVARLGGDEFAVVLADLGDHAAAVEATRRVADEIREHLARPFHIGGHEMVTGSSIGIALYPQDGETYSDLVKNADIAMYHAKQNGADGHAFFVPEMNARVVRRVSLETALRAAVRREELKLVYQPVVDSVAERVVGVEALLRWDGPQGPVSPLEFIPVLEDLGLGHDVARWVLATASREVSDWQFDDGAQPWLSVNFSPSQLHRFLLAWLTDALDHGRLPARRLMIEVTEDHFHHNVDGMISSLEDIRRLGARVALDDFGTGHSSLGRLRHFPIDLVKIDRSFVNGLPHDHKDLAIVNTIISMARHLGLDFLAEGVESEGQLNMLRRQGCGLIQGYIFARPMPARECLDWCETYHGRAGRDGT
ncbi:MAG: EAL domain-containing protein [Ectothiorhodospiraceae bacterium]|nr:EAL domain-containing protein [Ectothiorhodospiraceae bacterium]